MWQTDFFSHDEIPWHPEVNNSYNVNQVRHRILDLLDTDSFHIRTDESERQKFATDELIWNWSLTLYISPVSSVVEGESEEEPIPLNIIYSFEKISFIKGSKYWPNDRYDISISFEHPGLFINEHLQKHIQWFIENLIRSEHKDTNGD